MEQTECSEMLACKLQTPVNHPEESIQHSEQGKVFPYFPHFPAEEQESILIKCIILVHLCVSSK
jgi:hypothetical protein